MSLGLVTRASSGWRRVFGIADQGLVALLVRVAARRSGELIFRGRACTESSFLAFGAGPGSGRSKRLIFKGGLVQNRHFWTLVRVGLLSVALCLGDG